MATEPQIINRGNYKIIDPNPVHHTIDHEELFTYVSLVAKTKGRTFLTEKEDGKIEIKALELKTTDMAANRDKTFLSTDWTNIGGSQISTDPTVGDLEGFGITNIDIEIQSSFIPKVVIDFVDIRGATLFEQGSCSPYSLFFHLPYPVFELTVKGYYGKPVRYYLNLIKFNTKFNAETGNFESKGEFIGYSYAFLADMLMGMVMAAGKMFDWNSPDVLESKYEQTIAYYKRNGLFDQNTFSDENLQGNPDNPFCPRGPYGPECMTIPDLLRKIDFIQAFLRKVKGTVEYDEVGNLVAVRGQLQAMVTDIKEFSRKLIKEAGAKNPIASKKTNRRIKERFVWTEKPNAKVKDLFKFYFERPTEAESSDGTLLDDVPRIKNKVIRAKSGRGREASCAGSIVKLATSSGDGCSEVNDLQIYDVLNGEDWVRGFSEFNWNDGPVVDDEKYYIDLGYILDHIEKDIVAVDEELDLRREELREGINEGVRRELGFLPTVRNIFTVLACNTETFMELLLECCILAEQHHNNRVEDYNALELNDGNKRVLSLKGKKETETKVYPWPTYYEKDYPDITSTSGQQGKLQTKEVYPGERVDFQSWEEVRFVEDFLRAMLELNRELESLEDDKTGKPGFDNYTPIFPLENKLLANDIAVKYRDLRDGGNGQIDENILRIVGERMMIFFHHNLFDPVHINNINSGLGIGPKHKENLWDKKFIHYGREGDSIVKHFARMDADNLLNTIESDVVLRETDRALDVTNILDDVLEALNKYGTLTEGNVSQANPSYNDLFDENKNKVNDILNGDTYIMYTPPTETGEDGIKIHSSDSTPVVTGGLSIKADHNEMDVPFLFRIYDLNERGDIQDVTYKEDNKDRSEEQRDSLVDAIQGTRPKFIQGRNTWTSEGWLGNYENTQGLFFKEDKMFSTLQIGFNLYDTNESGISEENSQDKHSNMAVIGYVTNESTSYAGTQVKLYEQGGGVTDTPGDLLYPCAGGAHMWLHVSREGDVMPILEPPNNGVFVGATVVGNRDLGSGTVTFGDGPASQASDDQKHAWSNLTVYDTLIMTPLWQDNVNRYREIQGSQTINGRSFTSGTDAKLKTPPTTSNVTSTVSTNSYTSEDIQNRNLAYLFLAGCKPTPFISMGLEAPGADSLVAQDIWNNVYPKALYPLSQMGSITQVPRVWVLGMGATLWRWKTFMGQNTDSSGTILWRHPLWGDAPTGKDPLSQPGHPGNGYTSKRFSRSVTSTDSVIFQLFEDRPWSVTNAPRLTNEGTTNSKLQFSVFSPNVLNKNNSGRAALESPQFLKNEAWGYFYDYWGVFNNNEELHSRRPQSENYGTSGVWGRWIERYGNLWSRTLATDGPAGDEIQDTWVYDIKNPGYEPDYKSSNKQFYGTEDAANRTYWPLLWVTPWQHFYTEPVNIDGGLQPKGTSQGSWASNIVEKTLIFIPSDREYRDYRGSFFGIDWSNLDNDTENIRNDFYDSQTFDSLTIDERDYNFIYKKTSGGDKTSQCTEGRYGDMIALLPDEVKDEFVRIFEQWVDDDWSREGGWLEVVDPVHFYPDATTDLLKESYTVKSFAGNINRPGAELYGAASADLFEDIFIPDAAKATVGGVGLYDHNAWIVFNDDDGKGPALYKHLFEEYYTLLSSTPKLWNVVYQEFPHFAANKRLANLYMESFRDYWKKNYNSKQDEIDQSGKDDEGILGGSVIEDADTKLSLYRTFKSLSDKWVSSSKRVGNESRMFFNIVDNEYTVLTQDESDKIPLAGHFSYVNRVMGEIGNKAVIDITKLEKIEENPKMSLYQVITDLLSENKFDFFPLPSFTNFSSGNDEELKQMFTPVETLDGVNSGPNFICMFVGGTSRTLDMKPRANCPIDQDDMNHEDDSFSIINDYDIPTEINDPLEDTYGPDRVEGKGFTAFKVAYGIENQNHFKNITLDQTEFTETNESLLLIDRLAKGGDPANRESKGNNLHNVYLTRSYTCGVESLGNMMIQPLQYFELTNVPMFHGTYIITEVKHNIKPHHVGTSFKGTRQPMATVPVVTDTAIAMKLSIQDLKADGTGIFLDDIVGGEGSTRGVGGASTSSSNVKTIGDVSTWCKGSKNPMDALIINNGGENGRPQKGTGIELTSIANKIGGVPNWASDKQFLVEGAEPLKRMIEDLETYLKGIGYNSNTVRVSSLFRSYDAQEKLCCGSKGCYGKLGKCTNKLAAPPGRSKHSMGIAVDIGFYEKDGTKIPSGSGAKKPKDYQRGFNSDAYLWLYQHSYLYGFIHPLWARDGGTDEFWHWEYVGKAAYSYMAQWPSSAKSNYVDLTWGALDGEPRNYSFVKNPINAKTGQEAVLECVDTSDPQPRTIGDDGGTDISSNDPTYGKATANNASRNLTYTDKLAYIGRI